MEEKKIREGFLYLPSNSSSSISSIFWPFSKSQNKTWTRKRFALFGKSCQGLQRLEEGKSREEKGKKLIIPLNDCIKIWSPSPSLIEIISRSGNEYILRVDQREEELTAWLLALQQVAFGFMLEQEENHLYSSLDHLDSLFRVQVITSPIKSLSDLNDLHLRLTQTSIDLLSPASSVPVFIWNLRDIRRYGSSPETFTLEAGRRAASGPGIFSFATPKGSQLFSRLTTFLNDLLQNGSPQSDQFCQPSIAMDMPRKPPRRKRDADERSLSLTPPPSPQANFQVSSTSSTSGHDDNYCPDYENIIPLPTHYLQNEAEYAVVKKEKPKEMNIMSDV